MNANESFGLAGLKRDCEAVTTKLNEMRLNIARIERALKQDAERALKQDAERAWQRAQRIEVVRSGKAITYRWRGDRRLRAGEWVWLPGIGIADQQWAARVIVTDSQYMGPLKDVIGRVCTATPEQEHTH